MYESPSKHPRISYQELSYIETSLSLRQRARVVGSLLTLDVCSLSTVAWLSASWPLLMSCAPSFPSLPLLAAPPPFSSLFLFCGPPIDAHSLVKHLHLLAGVGYRHNQHLQQLGLLHFAYLPPHLPQGHTGHRHQIGQCIVLCILSKLSKCIDSYGVCVCVCVCCMCVFTVSLNCFFVLKADQVISPPTHAHALSLQRTALTHLRILICLLVWLGYIHHSGISQVCHISLLPSSPSSLPSLTHKQNGLLSGIPYAVLAVVGISWGFITDFFRRRGLKTVIARKANTALGVYIYIYSKRERKQTVVLLCIYVTFKLSCLQVTSYRVPS